MPWTSQAGRRAALAAACGALVACKATPRDRDPGKAGSPAETAVAEASTAQASAAEPIRRPLAPPRPCRAILVEGGVVGVEDAGPAPGRELAPDGFLALAAGARVVLKDPRTARETTFVGPGRARACVHDREEVWLLSGRLESAISATESPGAEQWVATPEAVFRYTAAQLGVDVRGGKTKLTVGAGTAFVWPADDARTRIVATSADAGGEDSSDPPWRRIAGGTLEIAAEAPADVHRTIARCRDHAARTRELARAVLARDAGSPAEAAKAMADQFRERRLARASCALAGTRLASAGPADAGGDGDALREANDWWSTLPLAPWR